MNITKNIDKKNFAPNKPNQNNFFSYNKSPQPLNKINMQKTNPFSISEPTKKYEYEENFIGNINLNDYLNNNQVNFYQNKNRNKQKSPSQNINYNRNYNLKPFDNYDVDNKNINYRNNKEDKTNNNIKKTIMKVKEQNKEEYAQYINQNYGNNNIYNYNNYYNGNYFNNNFNNNFNCNIKSVPQIMQGNLDNIPKKYNNYDNYKNYNKNKNRNRVVINNNANKNYQKYSQDFSGTNNNYLSDNNIKNNNKNQTQENYYKNAHRNSNQNNNESSSSNFYDDSYDYKTQYNFKKSQKQKIYDLAKIYNASSQDNSYSENKEENYNTSPFRLPLKNDEKHYHQNLTIKINNPPVQQKPLIKYVDNTPDGCIVLESNKNMEKRKQLNLNNNNINKENISKDILDKNKSYLRNKAKIEFSDPNKNENKNEMPKKYNKRLNINSPDNAQEKKNKLSEILEKKKKIREITLNISPKKKLHLSNSNQNLESQINKIQKTASPNINISQNQNSKIESCIITFDKNNKNNSKYNLSNSLDKTASNKIRYIKKKVITSNAHKNFQNMRESTGLNNKENKSGSMKKIYQKPGRESLSRSIGKSMENLEIGNEVKDYCAPSPNYGKRGKEAYLKSQNNKSGNINISINNNSPVLSSNGKFNLLDSNKKDSISPFKKIKYEEFSFKENDNDFNKISAEMVGIDISNKEDNINNNKMSDNFSIFNKQRIPSFSNGDLLSKNESVIQKKEKFKEDILSKLVIKSFSNKVKETKEKPKLIYNFYKKYYDIYLNIPEIEKMYMTKKFILKQNIEKKKPQLYGKIRKKYFNKKLINAPIRGKIMDTSAKDFYNRNKNNFSFNTENSLNYNYNNTLDIELDENKNNISSKKDKNTNITIKTVVKKIKIKRKNEISNLLNSNKRKMNINIESLKKKNIKTREEIKKEKKINSILKEDFENYIIFYKNNIVNNEVKKYDWSTIELLIIKIKLDIGDIINGYLNICEDLITEDEDVRIGNEYIANIIHHYKNSYLTKKNLEDIHNKILKTFLFIKDINIDSKFKYKILWGLLNNLINNELFYISDFDYLKQIDEDNKKNIKKILELCIDKKILEKINF